MPAPFVPPPALVLEAPTPAGRACRTTANEDLDREERRERAAVDAALRAQGFVPLEVVAGAHRIERVRTAAERAVQRRADGSSVLLVGAISGCGGAAPLVAMDATHEVFVVVPVFAAAHTRDVHECKNPCRGVCGAHMPDSDALAVVPPDATLGAARQLPVRIDTRVTFRFDPHDSCLMP